MGFENIRDLCRAKSRQLPKFSNGCWPMPADRGWLGFVGGAERARITNAHRFRGEGGGSAVGFEERAEECTARLSVTLHFRLREGSLLGRLPHRQAVKDVLHHPTSG